MEAAMFVETLENIDSCRQADPESRHQTAVLNRGYRVYLLIYKFTFSSRTVLLLFLFFLCVTHFFQSPHLFFYLSLLLYLRSKGLNCHMQNVLYNKS
jgi:hypothetical protein